MKRVWILLLALALFVGICFATSTHANATTVSQTSAVSWAKSKLGVGLDYDGVYGNQCVDLIYYYYRYLGVASPGGNACDFINNKLPTGWTRITKNIVPQPGDIAVWKVNYSDGTWTTGTYGHIGIVVSGNSSKYSMIHQNVGGVKTCLQSNNISTATLACVIRPNFSSAPVTPTLNWSVDTSRQSISYTNAVLANRCDISGVDTSSITKVGVVLTDYLGNKLAEKEEAASLGSYSYFYVWYDVNSSLKYTLRSYTSYHYTFWAEINGKKYYSPEYSFTTLGTHSHLYGSGSVLDNPTCTTNGSLMYVCTTCGSGIYEEAIPSTGHSYETTTTKATLTTNGSIVKKCTTCGDVASTTTIAKPTTFTLSTVNYTYNGAVKTPGVTVKDANGKTLVKGTDYTVTYPTGRKALGTYTVTVTMKGNYSGTKKLTFNIKLGTPTVTVANAANGVKVSWNKISGATSYKVYRSVYTNGAWSSWTAIKTGVTGTTYTDTSLKSNANVKYTVRAFNGSHSSTYKASSSIKFLAAPTVTVSNAANGVKISWNKIAGTKTYTVYKSVYKNGAWSGWKAIKTGVTGTTYTDTSVKSNDNVKYTVRAFNGNFSSTYKSSSSIKFLATPTVKAANAAKGVTVTWNKIAGAKTYTVYRAVYSGGKWSGWTEIKTGVTGTSYTDTTVKSGATVRYTVKAINGNFRSNVKTGNTTKYLAQPKVTVAKVSNGIRSSWGKITGASGYIVYRRTYTNGKWSGWTAIKTTTALSFTDTTAKAGVYYQYTVRAYSGDYRSSYTNSSSIKR